jgi:hypothetical protein
MKKKIIITLFLLIATYLIYSYGMDVFNHYYYEFLRLTAKPLSIPPAGGLPPPPPMQMEAGPLKVVIDSATPWESIAKLICSILGTYLGIKVINKYVK